MVKKPKQKIKLDNVKKEFFWLSWVAHRVAVLVEFTFSFLEMHMIKLVSFAIMVFCCIDVNALHMIIVIVLLLSMPLGSGMLSFAFRLIGIYLSLLLLTKMTYQTGFIPKMVLNVNCTGINLTVHDRLLLVFLDFKWLGYQLLGGGESVATLWSSYLIVLVSMTLHTVVYVRQKIRRIDDGKPGDIPPVLYPYINRQHADENIEKCVKYLFNYGFHKFGIEVTLTVAAFVIAYRMDVMSSLYAFWLAILFPLHRPGVSRVWPVFYVSVIVSILWQYAMVVGISPLACLDYPWNVGSLLREWLFLASYESPPDATKILADFVLLLCVWRQSLVFEIEKKDIADSYPGGSNKEVFMDYYKPNFVNPVPDQTSFNRSGLDWLKNFAVTSMLLVTLAFVYWTGVHNVNVLSLGYLVGSFVFLWIGYDLCLWHIQKILKWWNCLLAYTIFVIVFKSVYEVVGCVCYTFLNKNACWLVQLLNLGCTNAAVEEESGCIANKATVMYWDAVCFSLVLLQRRIFQSYYFLHHVEDTKTIVQLQAMGARLIEQLMQQQINESENKKRKTLEKIKKNMNRIKEWQKKIHGPNYVEPFDHATAVHMGDYYMFEEALDMDAVVDEEVSSSSEEEGIDREDEERQSRVSRVRELTMTQFIGTVFKRTTEDNDLRLKRRQDGDGKRMSTDEDHEEEGGAGTSVRRATQTVTEEFEGEEEPSPEEKDQPKLKSAFNFIMKFIKSVCVTMIRFFDKHSKDYRYINNAMKEERKANKARKTEYASEERNGAEGHEGHEGHEGYEAEAEEGRQRKSGTKKGSDDLSDAEANKPEKRKTGSIIAQLIISLSFFIMSHTEFFCYVIIFLHQALSPTILSLPLPLCVLLWGSLTTIRPTTTFWIVLIAYAEVTVVIKAMFQNWIFPWNRPNSSRHHPYHPPLLLGIHRNNAYATADLFLLFMLFLHRYKLKTQGMWKRTNEEDTSVPQNLGVYVELSMDQDNDHDDSFVELRHQLGRQESESKSDAERNAFKVPRLAKWKCTSRAMAATNISGGKAKTHLNVQEIEGQILVTHNGRRLQPTQATVAETSEAYQAGDIILRVYSTDHFQQPKGVYCKLSCLQHFTPIRKFFMQIVDQKGRLSADFYTLIFFFDFLTFLIVFFGFSHFTEMHAYHGEERFYFAENQVPLTYLLAVLIHFFIIITDRVLYLRKNVIGKLILQITLVLIVHVWMFLVLPKVTGESFTELVLPQIYYLIKCLYFLMSAYQMRVGYPLRVQGHFLCKKYGFVNYISYKGLQFIPFFNQLRTLLDYICIHSSLSMMEWIKVESIFQIIFENKCSRRADEEYPTTRGIMFPRCKKYVPGTAAFIFMVFIMWFPFFLFAIFESVSEANRPKSGVIELTIGTFEKVYSTKASYESIEPFSYSDFDSFKNLYKDSKKAWSFLTNYKHEDVAVLKFRFQPMEPWKIRYDEFDRLNETIQSKVSSVNIYLTWKIYRTERAQIVATASGTQEFTLFKSSFTRELFARAFRGQGNRIFLKQMLPKFIQVTNEGSAIPVPWFFSPKNRTNPYRNITLRLVMNQKKDIRFWEMMELADDDMESSKISKIPHQDDKVITIFTFNEKNLPKPLLNISRRGIIGLYLSIVLVTWTVVKRFMVKYPNIMFEDMPNVDRILQLCQDLYLARESHEFTLEEDLYAKLIFLFRSPETLIKWTRVRFQD